MVSLWTNSKSNEETTMVTCEHCKHKDAEIEKLKHKVSALEKEIQKSNEDTEELEADIERLKEHIPHRHGGDNEDY